MTFFQAVKYCIVQKYASGQGRASREEFFAYFCAFIFFCFAWSLFVGGLVEHYGDVNLLDFVLMYIPFIFVPPLVAVTVRRLHDAGKTGWLILLFLAPVLNILALGLLFLSGTPGPNRFGPEPRRVHF